MSRTGKLAVLDLVALIAYPGQEPEWFVDELGQEIYGDSPSWSPDGEWLAFSATWSLDPPGIWKIRPDGSDLQLLVPFSEPWGGNARWSPDGSAILFIQGVESWVETHLWLAEGLAVTTDVMILILRKALGTDNSG